MRINEIPYTREELLEIFTYDAETGELYWKLKRKSITSGTKAGNTRKNGYIRIKINQIDYLAHRLIWIIEKGSISNDCVIDHKNRIRNDNRIENLRLVSIRENGWNREDNGCEPCIWKCPKSRKYRAQIQVEGKIVKSSMRLTIEEAISDRDKIIKENNIKITNI